MEQHLGDVLDLKIWCVRHPAQDQALIHDVRPTELSAVGRKGLDAIKCSVQFDRVKPAECDRAA
jgi:hypothetical protein